MIEKQFLSNQCIISCLTTHCGIKVVSFMLLPLGADIDASVYKVEAEDQSSYFVKLKRGHHDDIIIKILDLLQEAGVQIIPPIKTILGRQYQYIEDFTLIVYPFMEGQDGFRRHLTDDQWQKLGNSLKQLHEIEIPQSVQDRIRRESYSPRWRETVRSLYTHIEAEPIQDEMAIKLSNFIKQNMTTIRRLVVRAEQLAQKITDLSPKFVLCHSDIHGGNVLIDGNDRIYIVDWDDPIMAPKERDLMFIGGGVANVWNEPHEEKLFYEGYGETEINPTILAYYRHERIVEDIAIYVQELLLSTAGGESRSVMYSHFIDMFEPNGVIEIAFKTDTTSVKYNGS